MHHRPVVLDQARVLADEIVGQFLDRRLDGQRAAFDHRLAPAGDAGIGLDLQEQPARRNNIGGQRDYFHVQCGLFSIVLEFLGTDEVTRREAENPVCRLASRLGIAHSQCFHDFTVRRHRLGAPL